VKKNKLQKNNSILEEKIKEQNRFFQKFRFNMSIFLYGLEYLFLVPKLELGNLLKKREQDVL